MWRNWDIVSLRTWSLGFYFQCSEGPWKTFRPDSDMIKISFLKIMKAVGEKVRCLEEARKS